MPRTSFRSQLPSRSSILAQTHISPASGNSAGRDPWWAAISSSSLQLVKLATTVLEDIATQLAEHAPQKVDASAW